MPIKVTCKCGKTYTLSESAVGKTATCKGCGEKIRIQSEAESATTTNLQLESSTSKPCPFCGEQIMSVAKKCKHCGEYLDPVLIHATSNHMNSKVSKPTEGVEPTQETAFMLCWFLGVFAAQRFYARKTADAIICLFLSLLTCGVAGLVTAAIDLVRIANGKFELANKQVLGKPNKTFKIIAWITISIPIAAFLLLLGYSVIDTIRR